MWWCHLCCRCLSYWRAFSWNIDLKSTCLFLIVLKFINLHQIWKLKHEEKWREQVLEYPQRIAFCVKKRKVNWFYLAILHFLGHFSTFCVYLLSFILWNWINYKRRKLNITSYTYIRLCGEYFFKRLYNQIMSNCCSQ